MEAMSYQIHGIGSNMTIHVLPDKFVKHNIKFISTDCIFHRPYLVEAGAN